MLITSTFSVGALFDATHNYPNSFYLGGGMTMFGALAMIPTAIGSRKNNFNKAVEVY